LPPSLEDWLPEKALAHFVTEVVDELDLSGIEAVYEKDPQGERTPPGSVSHPLNISLVKRVAYLCDG